MVYILLQKQQRKKKPKNKKKNALSHREPVYEVHAWHPYMSGKTDAILVGWAPCVIHQAEWELGVPEQPRGGWPSLPSPPGQHGGAYMEKPGVLVLQGLICGEASCGPQMEH